MNSFEMQDEASGRSVYATLYLLAHFNHSCSPNCWAYLDPNVKLNTSSSPDEEVSVDVLVRVVRPVRKGEELSISYLQLIETTPRRQLLLQDKYGFHCICSRCLDTSHPVDPYLDAWLPSATVAQQKQAEDLYEQAMQSSSVEASISNNVHFLQSASPVLDQYNQMLHYSRLHLSRAVRSSARVDAKDLTFTSIQLELAISFAKLIYPPHWPLVTVLYRDAYTIYKRAGDVAKADAYADKFNASRRVCMGPRCSNKVWHRTLLGIF
jgi:hypothetical protein